jgi:hypothetical protein
VVGWLVGWLGGWLGGWGEIEIKAKLSPAEAGVRAVLGKMDILTFTQVQVATL